MKRPFSLLGPGFALWMGIAAAGCTPSNKVKSGPPELVSFGVMGPEGPVELVTEAGETLVPPLATFVAVFDRLLDAAAIETIDDDGGISPNQGVAIIESDGMAVESTVLYVPNGDAKFTLAYPPGPSITVMPVNGLPSASTVTVSLSPAHVRSHDKTQPFRAADGGMETLTFTTEPLMATIDVPAPEPVDSGMEDDAGADGGTGATVTPSVDPDYVVNIAFNNQTADTTEATITAAATVAGVPVAALAATVARAMDSQSAWTVSPPMTGWPAGATVTVTVGAAAADKFGKTLGAAATATFTVKP